MKLNAENVSAAILFIFLLMYPLITSMYQVLNMANFLIMVFLSISLALVWGGAGIFSSGQTVFFGIGGYLYGIVCINAGETTFTLGAMAVGVLAATVVALVLGYFMFYGGVNDMFVGLIMLCVTLAAETFMAQTAGSEWRIGDALLGGYNGINGIPTISLGESFIVFEGISFYYLVFFLLLVVYLSLRKLFVSRWGYTLLAVRENRERSSLFGYNVPKIQMLVFTLGGAIASLSGILYAAWGGYMVPSTMSLASATLPIVMVAAGGRKNLTASMIFTLFYLIFSQFLSSNGSQYALIILGTILLLVMLFLPKGVIVALFDLIDNKVFSRFQQKSNQPIFEEEANEENAG